MVVIQTDRSRILTKQRCARERYWTYEHRGTGIQPIKKSLPLVFGSAFHEAAEVFLKSVNVNDHPKLNPVGMWGKDLIDIAVDRADTFLSEAFIDAAVDFDEPQTAYHCAEQKAMSEALVRGWSLSRRDAFLDTFEVLEVEQEGRAIISLHEPHVELLFRPDALVREKATGDYYIISWKTSSTFGPWVTKKCEVDMQSMSEVFGVEDNNSNHEGGGEDYDSNFKVEGVVYLFAVKGQRRMDDYRGHKIQNSPLIYAWMKEGAIPEEDEWTWLYEWDTEEINPKTGKFIRTKLGKGWRKVPIWERYPGGVKAWVEDLAAQEIAPRHLNIFDQIFPEMLPVSRKASDIESWRRQAVSQELRVAQAVKAVECAHGPDQFQIVLDREFPQSTDHCFSFGGKCPVYDICWNESVKAMEDPLQSGLYQIRVANHPEKEAEE